MLVFINKQHRFLSQNDFVYAFTVILQRNSGMKSYFVKGLLPNFMN